MEGTRSETVADLVEAALELEPVERVNFLDRECGDDTQLRGEVESLLKFQPQARRFIETPAYEVAADTLAEEVGELKRGDTLGDYVIESLLGEGGMGEVYLARDTELGRTVAIKLIKRAFARANFLRQFRQEERILAGLTHPNIARLYGGAVTRDGLPFFVMEYVEGERLDAYCSSHQLTIRERLEMFQKICAAVAYAHQHLVIHRDLKPANIRVTPEGEPKLLDFGIAKLIDDANTGPTGETMTLAGVMTPEYASPEQVRGEPMTTASDVYSLGVILYETLTGEKPYRLTSRRPDDISRTITEHTPARPSTLTAANRKSLRGDLDNIVLMAMRKEPARRYASVGALALDIARHLEGRPVSARKDTWSYRSGKFIRRHKLAVAAALLLLVSLLGGIFATTWQARRAEQQRALAQRRFDEVRRLARSLMFEIHDSVADLPGSTTTRQLIVSRALEYLNNLSDQAGNDPSLARELAAAYVKVGNVQGNPNNANLGDTAGALQSFDKAQRLMSPLLAANPLDAQSRRLLALAEEKMADVLAVQGNLPGAVENARRSLAAFEEIANANPSDVAAQRSVAISHLKNGDVLGNPNFANRGDTQAALAEYGTALNILQKLPRPEGDDFKTERMIGVVEERLGTMFETAHDVAAARQHYESSCAIRLRLAEQQPHNFDVVRDAAVAHEKIANVLTTAGDLNGALAERQRSLAIFQQLAESDPRNVFAQQSLAVSYMHLADLLGRPDGQNLGRVEEAIQNFERAADILEHHADNSDAKTREALESARSSLQKLRSTAAPNE
ncbi:MAG TPA: protein kinase [Chthoniobacterales bacterium]